MLLIARNEEINQWLNENPAVLGGGALLIGLLLLGFGVAALTTGRSRSKHGREFNGPMAYLHGALLTGFGTLCVLFALYKLVFAFTG